MYDLTTLIIGAILLMVFSQFMNGKTSTSAEGYHPNVYYKKYCPECGYKSRKRCGKCSNCGVCTTRRGQSSCIPGGPKGPYFRDDCAIWEYGQTVDPYHHGYYYYPRYYARYGNQYYSRPRLHNRRRYRHRHRHRRHGTH